MQWVLIRGIVSEKYHWGDFLHRMQDRFPQYRFEAADILGNGQSRHQHTPISAVTHIQGFKKQVTPGNKKIVLGFSLGGILALEWAYHHPEEIEALVLINISMGISPAGKRLKFSAVRNIFKAALKKDLLQKEEMILKMTTSQLEEEKLKAIAQDWGSHSQQNPIKAINFFRQLILASRIKPRSHAPPIPILILSSERDQVVDSACSKQIAQMWNLKHETHPIAGHDLTLEDPQWVLDKVENWLKEWKAKHQDSGLRIEQSGKPITP